MIVSFKFRRASAVSFAHALSGMVFGLLLAADPGAAATAEDAATAPVQAPAPAAEAAAPAAAVTKLAAPPAASGVEAGSRVLLVAQAHFIDQKNPTTGKVESNPGPARLIILREGATGWTSETLDDPESNVFHKAVVLDGKILTIGGNEALLKTWSRGTDGKWTAETHWHPKFGGKANRLRDFEVADVDGDGKQEIVIATHDQGVIAIVHPDENWRVEEIDRTPATFVHEIEIGDVDGDHQLEIFATPSKPNRLREKQAGEVVMYRRGKDGKWARTVVDAPGDTHAKEILAADTDGDGKSELFIDWEGAFDQRRLLREVTIKQYRWDDKDKILNALVANLPDSLSRATAAGDVTGDGRADLVAGSMMSGLWLLEQTPAGWKRVLIDGNSSGFEQPVLLVELDGKPPLEIVVASEDQAELRTYRRNGTSFEKEVLAPLQEGDFSWNVNEGRLPAAATTAP